MKPDIFFLSYDEPNAEINWQALQRRFPAAKRVQGIKGIAEAHRTCSELSETDFYFLVDADNEVHSTFNFDLPEANPDLKTVYVWRCLNPVNGLKYGYGAIKLFPKGLFSQLHFGADVTTSVAPKYKIIHEVASTTVFNSSPLQAWRSAFRECAKLSSQGIKSQKAEETAERLKVWTEVKSEAPFADWTLKGAQQGKLFGERHQHGSKELLRINDYDWLNASFNRQQKIEQLLSKKKFSPDEVSKTFCILPWVHLSTRPNGHMRVCCTANASSVGKTNDKEFGGEVGIVKNKNGRPANLNHTDLLEGWNNDYMKNVRLQMLDGKKPASCLKCYREEAAGHRSKRNWETAYWWSRVEPDKIIGDTDIDGEIPPKLYYIDLRLGTKCNLKCVMCSPHDSSMWVSDWNKLYPQLDNPALKQTMNWQNKGQVDGASYNWHKDNPTFWTQLYDQIPHMKQLYFAGGESTIIKEHYDLLEECVRRGEAHHIELRYNSNGVEMPEKLFKLWEHFKLVRFHFSIDSIEDMNSYIRYPSRWDQIEKQLWMLDGTGDNVEVTIACAVQILNIHYIPDFIRWKLDQGFKKINPWPLGAGLINFHFVYHPPHLNVKVLPEAFKLKTTEKLNRFCEELEQRFSDNKDFVMSSYGIPRIKGMVSFMNSENWSNRMPEFREYIEKMDQIRGTDFKQTFPEMAELLEVEPEMASPRPPMKRLADFLFRQTFFRVLFFLLIFSITLGTLNSEAQISSERVAPLIKKIYSDVETRFESDCSQKICRADEFIAQLPTYQPQLTAAWVKRWHELKALDPAVGARTWISEIYLNLKALLPAEAKSEDLRVATFIWLVLERLVNALDLPTTDPAFLTLMSELQYRSLIALQPEKAWEIAQLVDEEKALTSIDGVRILLGKAQLLTFFGAARSAYRLLEQVLKSEVFKSPVMITSNLHQLERGWAWHQLIEAAKAMERKNTAAIIEHIAAEKIYTDIRETNLKWWWEGISKTQSTKKLELEVRGKFVLSDSITMYFWDFVRQCGEMSKGGCNADAALSKTNGYLNTIHPELKLTYIQ